MAFDDDHEGVVLEHSAELPEHAFEIGRELCGAGRKGAPVVVVNDEAVHLPDTRKGCQAQSPMAMSK